MGDQTVTRRWGAPGGRATAATRYARAAVSADEETPDVDDPQPCSVCRGTGTLISNLGGSPSTVTCAWCEGTGTFLPDHDAQAAARVSEQG
jgi:DnaJ-class molecular chaperone